MLSKFRSVTVLCIIFGCCDAKFVGCNDSYVISITYYCKFFVNSILQEATHGEAPQAASRSMDNYGVSTQWDVCLSIADFPPSGTALDGSVVGSYERLLQ